MEEVVVYGTPTCSACKKLKEYLNQKDIDYKYVEVGSDIAPAIFLDKFSEPVVPVLTFRNNKVKGFDKRALDIIFN
jgi:glutaredoxin